MPLARELPRGPDAAETSYRMAAGCCDFSPPASRTARRSSTILEGMPAGLADRLRRASPRSCAAARAATAAAGAWRSNPTAREIAERRPPRRDDRRADRAADPEQGLGELAAHDARRARRCRRTRPAPIAPPVTRPRPGPRRPRRRRQVRPRRHPRRARARQRARDGGARRRRRDRPAAARAVRRRDRQPRRRRSAASALAGSARASRSTQARAIADDAPLHCADRGRRAADDRGDRCARARPATRMGGAFEVIATRRAAGPRQLRAVGSQARWPAGAGADVDSRDQGGRHRPRPGRRVAARARASTTRSCRRAGRTRPADRRVARPTNNAGGLEGGVTNGEDLRVTGYMKPIATLMKPLRSVDLDDARPSARRPSSAATSAPSPPPPSSAKRWSRSCSPTRSLEKFGGDSIDEIARALRSAAPATVRRALHAARRPRRRALVRRRMIRPILRYGDRRAAPPAGAGRRRSRRRSQRAHRRHDRDDVRGARRRPGGAAGRRAAAHLRRRHLGRPRSGGAARRSINPEFVERDGMQLEEEGCLSVPGSTRRSSRPSRAVRQGPRSRRRGAAASKARACSRARSSTRWITSTARCSSIACAASSAI